ncbi:MAG: DUF2807 domain-containing protein [Dysgonamonadaceae bacterium]|jgi:phage shock protein PspC (stress-responsive transcriptional regulator)|nr:DUF2807 domain-containing protein [Dysgonamonadaceae bacterium]
MKKTLTVNLNGRVLNIDEDAYTLLDNYLRNLRVYFSKDEGFTEIIADFEARIEELFSEHIRSGYEVISIEQVESVIKQVGKPEDFEGTEPENTRDKTFEETKDPEFSRPSSGEKKIKKRLHRNIDNKLAGGVFSGIAAYFGWDETAVRLAGLIILIVIMPVYGWGIWLYLILWIIIPPAKTAQQKLEMRGEEVSIENIGKVVSEETTNSYQSDNNGCLGSILGFFAALVKVILVGLGILIGLPLIFAMIIVLITVFAILIGVGGGLIALPFGIAGLELGNITFTHPTLALITSILVAGIPLLSLIYWIVAHFAKLSPMPKSIKITGLIVWIIALIILISSGLNINWNSNAGKFRNGHRHIGWFKDTNKIEGNGIVTDKTLVLPYFESLSIDDDFFDADVIITQVSDTGQLFIRGESNIIDQIKWSVKNGKLKLSIDDNTFLVCNQPILIKVSSPEMKGVMIESVGNVKIPNKMELHDFYIDIDGAGHFSADSLFCNDLKGNVKGIGNVELKGKASKADFKLRGAGNINALDFETEDVTANVKGIGNIKCDPTRSFNGKVEGIGSINYKNVPPVKNVKIEGLGNISKN